MIFVIGHDIEMKWIKVGVLSLMKLSFLKIEVTK